MSGDENLIEEAAKALFEVDQKTPWPLESTASLTDFKDMARAALSVFEKAHTHTDDEADYETCCGSRTGKHFTHCPIYRTEPQAERSEAQYPQVDAFAERMRAELIANAHKGDAWQNMTVRQAWGEISWHVGKLTGAIKSGDAAAIRELAADIANGALMLDEIIAVNQRLDAIGRAAGGVR